MQAFDPDQAPGNGGSDPSSAAKIGSEGTHLKHPSNLPHADEKSLEPPADGGTRPVLDFKQLAEHRMDDLRQLYTMHGVPVHSEEDLLQQIRKDWGLHRHYAELANSSRDNLRDPTPITLDVDGRRYHMFGTYHSWTTGTRYQGAFSAALTEFNDVVAEQGMRMYFRLPAGSVSCADWAPIRTLELLKLATAEAFDIREALRLVAGLILPFQRREAERSTAQLWEFFNEVDGLPDQVARELQVASGAPLDLIQRRSQYQAEFAKNWGSDNQCALLVGGLHATEIRDYLKYGVEDPEIRELARLHATMAREDPFRYHTLYAYYWARGLCIGVLGFAIGLSPWVGVAMGLRQWLLSL